MSREPSSVRVAKKPKNADDLKEMLEKLAEAMCSDSPDSCQADF